jgi:thiol-disulfide isomerase/thioredoxin
MLAMQCSSSGSAAQGATRRQARHRARSPSSALALVFRAAFAGSLALAACARHDAPGHSTQGHAALPATTNEAPPPPAAATTEKQGLPWYEDAPDAAFDAARAAGKLVLIDLWAPWCHSCLSMQSFVLTAANFPALTQRFVLLAIDTERAENAEFLRSLPVSVWPTFYVTDPDRAVLGRWLGTAAPAQFARFLAESDRSAELRGSAQLPANDPRVPLGVADQQATRGEFREAAASYARALALAPADWPRRPETLVAQITMLSKAGEQRACLELAGSSLAQIGTSMSAVDFSSHALGCAESAPPADALAASVRQAAEQTLRGICLAERSELTPDDQADGCANLAEARSALGNEAGARAALEQRLAILQRAEAGKPDALAVALDWALTDTLISQGRAQEAADLAARRERALPDNYNPPHYLAKAYKALGRNDEGLAALERALRLAYGPRRISLLSLKADLLLAAGRKDEARQVVADQLAQYRALPEGQRSPAREKQVEQRLASWR